MSATIGHDGSTGWVMTQRPAERAAKRAAKRAALAEAWAEATEALAQAETASPMVMRERLAEARLSMQR